MPGSNRSRSSRRAMRLRQQRRRRLLRVFGIALAAAALAVAVLLIAPGRRTPARTATPTERPLDAVATVTSAAQTPGPTVPPTTGPSPTPTAAPRPTPADMPSVISFYRPKDKSYSPRVRMGDSFQARWKRGQDIGSFEVIASDAEELPGSFFGDIFGKAWTSFADAGQCRIGYTLRYELDDGREIRYTMLSPQHIEHTEYIECWLYDDYHRKPHQSYSHIKKMKSDTLMTSIKLTCGREIAHVRDIWLTAFVCASLDEFDAERNYTGSVSRTIHITRK